MTDPTKEYGQLEATLRVAFFYEPRSTLTSPFSELDRFAFFFAPRSFLFPPRDHWRSATDTGSVSVPLAGGLSLGVTCLATGFFLSDFFLSVGFFFAK